MTTNEMCRDCERSTYGLMKSSTHACSICGTEFGCHGTNITFNVKDTGQLMEYSVVCPVCFSRILRLMVELEGEAHLCLANPRKEPTTATTSDEKSKSSSTVGEPDDAESPNEKDAR